MKNLDSSSASKCASLKRAKKGFLCKEALKASKRSNEKESRFAKKSQLLVADRTKAVEATAVISSSLQIGPRLSKLPPSSVSLCRSYVARCRLHRSPPSSSLSPEKVPSKR